MMCFIVAMDRNRVIGKDNQLPWHLPGELAYFKKVTTGHSIVMGRKTYESIGRPLPNRENIILTKDQNYVAPGCKVVHSYDEVIEYCSREEECFIIGGSELFALFWEDVDRLYVTYIDEEFPGDTYFPEFDQGKWELVSVKQGIVDEKNQHKHEFRVYERKHKDH